MLSIDGGAADKGHDAHRPHGCQRQPVAPEPHLHLVGVPVRADRGHVQVRHPAERYAAHDAQLPADGPVRSPRRTRRDAVRAVHDGQRIADQHPAGRRDVSFDGAARNLNAVTANVYGATVPSNPTNAGYTDPLMVSRTCATGTAALSPERRTAPPPSPTWSAALPPDHITVNNATTCVSTPPAAPAGTNPAVPAVLAPAAPRASASPTRGRTATSPMRRRRPWARARPSCSSTPDRATIEHIPNPYGQPGHHLGSQLAVDRSGQPDHRGRRGEPEHHRGDQQRQPGAHAVDRQRQGVPRHVVRGSGRRHLNGPRSARPGQSKRSHGPHLAGQRDRHDLGLQRDRALYSASRLGQHPERLERLNYNYARRHRLVRHGPPGNGQTAPTRPRASSRATASSTSRASRRSSRSATVCPTRRSGSPS